MKKVIHSNLKKIISSAGVASLLILPVLSTNLVFADTAVTYEVEIEPTLNISVSPSTVSLNLNPLNHAFDTEDLSVLVSTNNSYGYKLYVDADATNLTNTNPNIPSYIQTLDSGTTYTESNFPANRWGYRISSGNTGDPSITNPTNFYPFVSNTLISSASTPITDNSSTLTFASKVDYEQPAGTYNLDLNFKALPIVTTYTIQEIADNPNVCTEELKTVTDTRDGQSYTIARLKDGRCWMLDNLRLDIADSAVQAKLNSTTTNATDEALNYLINGGGTSPYPASGVSKEWTSSAQNVYDLPYITVSGDRSEGGTWNRNTVSSVIFGDASNRIGVFYNYCAASAGSYCYAKNRATGDAQYDVCPVGWSLPTGGANGDFRSLCNTYKGSECANPDSSPSALTMLNAFSVIPSGIFDNGTLDRMGVIGAIWSSTIAADSSNNIYSFTYNSDDGVRTFNNNARYRGFSIRCILTES